MASKKKTKKVSKKTGSRAASGKGAPAKKAKASKKSGTKKKTTTSKKKAARKPAAQTSATQRKVTKAPVKAPKAPAKAQKAPAKKANAKQTPAKVAKASAKKTMKKALAKVVKSAKSAKATLEDSVKTATVSVEKALKRAVKAASENLVNASESALDVGALAPAFSLRDQAGVSLNSAELSGQPYVLYFYPKDDTPGCTREACGFRDDHQAFRDAGITVIGVSPDSTKSHAAFATKYSLPFRLLSDPDKVLAQAYGAWGSKQNYGRQYMGIIRSTFIIGADGRVLAVYRGVKVDGHVQKVLERATAGAA